MKIAKAWRLVLGGGAALVVIVIGVESARALRVPKAATQERETVTLRLILTDSADAAQRVVEQVRRGASFANLARNVSIDVSSDTGGLLGTVALSALRLEVRQALRTVRAGQITPVIPVPTGFAVLQVVDSADARDGSAAPTTLSPAIAATAGVQWGVLVSGYSDALATFKRFDMPRGWEQDPRSNCDGRMRAMKSAEGRLADRIASAAENVEAQEALGQAYSFDGNMSGAIRAFTEAYEGTGLRATAVRLQTKLGLDRPYRPSVRLAEILGVAYLHRAKLENGLAQEPGDRCLLTDKGTEPLTKTDDARKAIEYFEWYLAQRPNDLEVRWLLNLAYMNLGGYPSNVPARFLIPPSSLRSPEDVGRFVDVAQQAGLHSVSSAGGVIVDDFDNDGQFEIVTSSLNPCGRMHFFHRRSDGTFVDQASSAGLDAQTGGGLNVIQADYDNDGYVDLLLLRGGWESGQRKSLLHNNGDGTFTDVTESSGLARPITATQTAVWTDVNNDGLLDLFVGNENAPAQLFLNKGNGTFVDVAADAGVNRVVFAKGVAAGDYDNDGWPDLYVSNNGGPNLLYHNNHDGTFTDVAKAAGVQGSGRGFATWFFDYDNDGWPDLFATSYFVSVDEGVRTYLDLPHNVPSMKLYRNLGNGTFRDVTAQVGLNKVFLPMGANFGDIDNDGYPDIYLGTGAPSYAVLLPSVLLHNQDGRSFSDVTASSGTGELHKGHGVAFADLDNDGNEDIVFEVGGATPGDAHALRAFHNPGHANDWITIKLVGQKSNRSAIGARIKVVVENAGQGRRTVQKTVGSGGSFGASPLAQHIGLGKNARIVDVEITWPTSKTAQRLGHVDANQWLQVTEFANAPVRLERPRLPLGSEARSARGDEH
jgi:hypothetical protein